MKDLDAFLGNFLLPIQLPIGKSPSQGPSAGRVRHLRVSDDYAGQRVDNFLMRELKGCPRRTSTASSALVKCASTAVACAETKLAAGDEVRCRRFALLRLRRLLPPRRISASHPVGGPASAGGEQTSGTAVHGGSGISFRVIEQLRIARPQAPLLELVHRLDRDTSGVLLIAKTRAAWSACTIPCARSRATNAIRCGPGRVGERPAARQGTSGQIHTRRRRTPGRSQCG